MSAVVERRRGVYLLPTTGTGLAAAGVMTLALVLLFARIVLTPALGLPLDYLAVFLTMATSGVLALVSVAFRHERSVMAFVILIGGLMAGAFLLAESFGGPPPVTSLGEGDNGKTVTVQKGGQIMIQLPGNPTTGYSWDASVSNPAVVTQSSSPVYKPSTAAIGAGGVYTFWYQAAASGRTDLTFVYRRAWETDTAPLETFKVSFIVQ